MATKVALGLVIALQGAVLYLVASLLFTPSSQLDFFEENVLPIVKVVAIAALIGGPLVFSIAMPLLDRFRRF